MIFGEFVYSALAINIYFLVDGMNTQVHSSTGSHPYELLFGQKPRAVLFPNNSDDVDVVFLRKTMKEMGW